MKCYGHHFPPIHVLKPVQEKEELYFNILSLQDYTATMCPGLSKGAARPSLVPLTFSHWWLTSGLPVRAETKLVQSGSSLAGTLFTFSGRFNNSGWHLLEYIFQQVACQSLDEIRPSVWCQSPTLCQFKSVIQAGKASPKDCFSPEHAAKPGLAICCSKKKP